MKTLRILICEWAALALPAVTMAQVIIIPPSGGVQPSRAAEEGARAQHEEIMQRSQQEFEAWREGYRASQQGPQYQWKNFGRHRTTIGSVGKWCAVRVDERYAATLLTECSEQEALP